MSGPVDLFTAHARVFNCFASERPSEIKNVLLLKRAD